MIGLATAWLISFALPADARGFHGGHGLGGHGFREHSFGGHSVRAAPIAGNRAHGNDAYVKAASEERGKLLNTKIKSICRGC